MRKNFLPVSKGKRYLLYALIVFLIYSVICIILDSETSDRDYFDENLDGTDRKLNLGPMSPNGIPNLPLIQPSLANQPNLGNPMNLANPMNLPIQPVLPNQIANNQIMNLAFARSPREVMMPNPIDPMKLIGEDIVEKY